MFVSTEYLSINYGVNDAIAKFFVDRDPPPNNLYWHGKLLYLRPGAGYIFIPLIVDLLYRAGIDRHLLTADPFLSLMEKIGHISALEETRQISEQEAVRECAALAQNSVNLTWYAEVCRYFNGHELCVLRYQRSPFNALHRGDVFLFSLAALPFDISLHQKLGEIWFALITTLLLMDDADDLLADRKSGEENAYIESGLTETGVEALSKLVENNLKTITQYNKTMALQLRKSYQQSCQLPYIASLIKHN